MHILADIGGTKMRLAATADGTSFSEPLILDTPQSYDDGIALIKKTSLELAAGAAINSFVAGIPVLLSTDKRSIQGAKNIPDWKGRAIAKDIGAELTTTVHLENDVPMIALGEAIFGAGVGSRRVMYLTVSTGVNAALIVNGKLDPNNRGVSTGCQYVTMGETPVVWEDLISGSAIQKRYGKHPKEVGKNDPLWEELARVTAFGVHNSVIHWTPDRVILGGSMFKEIGISVERVLYHLESIHKSSAELPEVVHSKLGDVGGLWGGLAFVAQQQK